MELKEAYLKMQDNCGIEEGDTVRVLRKAKDREMGWETCWIELMNEAIGNTYKVMRKNGAFGIRLDFKNSGCWLFPFFVLELVEKKKEHKSTNQLILMKAILVIAKNEELMNHVEMQDLEQRIKEIESNDE